MPAEATSLYKNPSIWLDWLSPDFNGVGVDGLVPVNGYDRNSMRPEEVAIMEKAAHYGAHFVFFEARRNDRSSMAQAFVYVSDGYTNDEFADLHRKLWNWGGVPLVYRKVLGKVDLFRCVHEPEFFKSGQLHYKPHKSLELLVEITEELSFWDASRLRNGTLWDDPKICRDLLDAKKSAHRGLVKAVKGLNAKLTNSGLLNANLRRRLLILTLLVEYLEEREVLKPDWFAGALAGATRFFDILKNGSALVNLFDKLKDWFNGDVFNLEPEEQEAIRASSELEAFATLVEGFEEPTGQLNFWRLYSFDDLPVELISEIYQLFVEDEKTAVYTPPALVRLILEEVLDKDRMKRLLDRKEVILDPACGSGVFLVEAYKRLILHWRSENHWMAPPPAKLKELAKFVHGVDVEPSAIELTNFSLCLAMCDALKPRDIEDSVQLFPPLKDKSLHKSCFFEAKAQGIVPSNVGVVVGNPPFESRLKTRGAIETAQSIKKSFCPLPDKQVAYLFLQQAMEMLTEGGLLGMIQQSGFLYNEKASAFRKQFFERWNVREVLDFVSIRGMFDKDTKIIVLVAEASEITPNAMILHAVFRRYGRADAEQYFEVDYYDMHWLPNTLDWSDWRVWRAGLFGGSRFAGLISRLASFPTLANYAKGRGWKYGQGFIRGNRAHNKSLDHLWGLPLLPPELLTENGIPSDLDLTVPEISISDPKSEEFFKAPLFLVRKHLNLDHDHWNRGYLTFGDEIVGFSGNLEDSTEISEISDWFSENIDCLRAYAAGTSIRLYNKKATALGTGDILNLPLPTDRNFRLNSNERIVAEDAVDHYSEIVRFADDSKSFNESGLSILPAFNETFISPINGIYSESPLIAHPAKTWPGVICQPYSFGPASLEWENAGDQRDYLDSVLKERRDSSLSVTRIARVYDGNMLYLIKPDRLRFWLRSIALRDADEVLADLRAQGF